MYLTPEQIARVCHEASRAYSMSIGDHTLVPWDSAPRWQKHSVLEGVKAALEDPSMTPEQIHELWMGEKERTGWKYGLKKRPEVKEHPCMLPYGQLSEDHRKKDDLFLAVARALQNDVALVEAAPEPSSKITTKKKVKKKSKKSAEP